jgi:hypothetical protein
MSGSHAPPTRGISSPLRLPRVPASQWNETNVAINAAFDLLERADTASVKAGQQPTFPGIVLLSSPGRIGFLLTVSDAGALQITQLPPTRPF